MKRMTLAVAMLSLVMICSITGIGQSKSKSRVKPPSNGGQICTGCCDPCYSDDGWKIRNQQPNAKNAKPPNKTSIPPVTKKGKR